MSIRRSEKDSRCSRNRQTQSARGADLAESLTRSRERRDPADSRGFSGRESTAKWNDKSFDCRTSIIVRHSGERDTAEEANIVQVATGYHEHVIATGPRSAIPAGRARFREIIKISSSRSVTFAVCNVPLRMSVD